MVMGVDEAGHDNVVRCVDNQSRAAGIEVGAECRDLLAFDQNIGLFEIPHLRVEAQHDSSPQKDSPAL